MKPAHDLGIRGNLFLTVKVVTMLADCHDRLSYVTRCRKFCKRMNLLCSAYLIYSPYKVNYIPRLQHDNYKAVKAQRLEDITLNTGYMNTITSSRD